MTLIKTSIFSLFATVVKTLSGLAINKAVAVSIGPTGLALIGQFHNFYQLTSTIAQCAISNGVTKYTAEYKLDSTRLVRLISTAAKISLASSIAVGLAVLLFSNYLSVSLLKTNEYRYVFIIYGATIPLLVANGLLLAILNGLREIDKWALINISQSVCGLVITVGLIFWLGIDGALLALAINQSIVFIIIIILLRNHFLTKVCCYAAKFSAVNAKLLAAFSAMGIVSAAAVPVSQLVVRNYIGGRLGWEQAGYWQAMSYISNMYLMVVTTTLSTYYLPRLSELGDKVELRQELIRGYLVILPLTVISAASLYLLRGVVVHLLFAESFSNIRDLFFWQLIGDVFKLSSWLMAYLMLAKAMTKAYILTEIVFGITFIVFSVVLVNFYGIIGMSYSHAATYFLYMISMVFVTKDRWSV